jgi:hypothetical protein
MGVISMIVIGTNEEEHVGADDDGNAQRTTFDRGGKVDRKTSRWNAVVSKMLQCLR